eukprot:3717896-Rhodomonas_salina.1
MSHRTGGVKLWAAPILQVSLTRSLSECQPVAVPPFSSESLSISLAERPCSLSSPQAPRRRSLAWPAPHWQPASPLARPSPSHGEDRGPEAPAGGPEGGPGVEIMPVMRRRGKRDTPCQ